MTGFASKNANRHTLQALALRDKLKVTQPYEGSLSSSEPSFTLKETGKATFKVKQQVDSPKTAETTNKSMLTNEELKEICFKNGLARGEVFDIRAKYASMCLMSEHWVAERNNPESKNFLDFKRSLNPSTKDRKSADGINVDYFIEHCIFLAGGLPHVNKRILVATGKYLFG